MASNPQIAEGLSDPLFEEVQRVLRLEVAEGASTAPVARRDAP